MKYHVDLNPAPVSRRFWAFTGTLCNYKCIFCYYQNNLHRFKSINDIKHDILLLKRAGATSVDLSGGEVTIRPDFFQLLDFCTEQFGTASIVSNGSKLADYNFVVKAKEHGLSEVLLSLHGSNKEIYEGITRKLGSFDKIIKAIKNCKQLGLKTRINFTACDENTSENPDELCELIKELNPFQLNFILVNPFVDNTEFKISNLSNITNYIIHVLARLEKECPNIQLNTRYIPFCYLGDYKKYGVNYFQHVYDTLDWNPLSYIDDLTKLKPYTTDNQLKLDAYEICTEQRDREFKYHEKCFKCAFTNICDGFKKGMEPLNVNYCNDEQIHNPLFFKRL